jgi:Domain of unknown function (DUF4382)
MRCLARSFRITSLSAVAVFACLAFTSCGTTCVSGIFVNGNGVILVQNSTPPPSCPTLTAMSSMSVSVSKSQVCETCTLSRRPQHIFVTISGIQLHSASPDSPTNPEWIELAPQLLRGPRQLDLVGDSAPEILVPSARIPAGLYSELRLQFSPDTFADSDALPTEDSCARTRPNCMLMADGRVETLQFTGNTGASELLLPLQFNGSSALAVVPGATIDLRLTLQPQQVFSVSPSQGLQIHYVLLGTASVSR